jgi:hypothetical protein
MKKNTEIITLEEKMDSNGPPIIKPKKAIK